MKIAYFPVMQLTISEINGPPHRLDPITVLLEDLAPQKGRIMIRCYDRAWTAYWGGMGEQTLAQFFCSCNEDYLAGNLAQGIEPTMVDADSIEDGARRRIIALRRGQLISNTRNPAQMVRIGRNELTAEEARELWEELDYTHLGDDGWAAPRLMEKIFGEEWWYRLPSKPNPEYQYLCRVIRVVQAALKQVQPTATHANPG